ncbi:MAG: 16S rRNA (cytosine(967)-C(5))-methyltransferase, partial [Gammaproteobacteria bacterium]|nr:16S rRNA (cytosine(967)-C(5))-methyltransferase [Gammaproteobacteria bacterium]
MSQAKNPRTIAALAILHVVFRGRQLNRVLEHALDQANSENRGIITEVTYGVVRWFWLLEHELNQLLDRPVRRKDQDVLCLLCMGLYQ